MTTYTGQDSGTPRVTIREAASRLGVTEGAIRKRIQRGSLPKEHGEDGRVYVYLDMYQDKSHPESQVDHDPLVEELRDRVRFMERQLEAERDAHREARRIIAGLVQRIPELESPAHPEASQRSETTAQETSEAAPGPAPRPGGVDDSRASERSWWRRVFGGG
jgi:hypothetical protein